jgi:hypothetical protein
MDSRASGRKWPVATATGQLGSCRPGTEPDSGGGRSGPSPGRPATA